MRHRILPAIMTGIMLMSIVCSCHKKTSTEYDINVSHTDTRQISSEHTSSDAIIENMNDTDTQVSENYNYKDTKIAIGNNISDIYQIIEKNGILYGVGAERDENWNYMQNIFSIDVNSSSVYFYPYTIPDNHFINSMAVGSEEEIFFITYMIEDITSSSEIIDSYSFQMIDKNGILQLSIPLSEYSTADPFKIAIGNDDNLFIQTTESILVFDRTGSFLFDIDLSEEYYNYHALLSLYDGTVVVPVYADDKIVLQKIDIPAQELQAYKELSFSRQYSIYPGYGKDAEIYLFGDIGVYSYSLTSGEEKLVMNLLDMGFNSMQARDWCVISSEQFAVLYPEEHNIVSDITILTKSKEPAGSRTTITLATYWPDLSLISEFNRKNESYRIEVINFSESDLDHEEAKDRLRLEILTGNSPDILHFIGYDYEEFAESGVFKDLYPFFETDPELNIDSLVEGVAEALSYDGELLAIAPKFGISTILGDSSVIGDNTGIGIDELIQLDASLNEGARLFNSMSNLGFVSLCCSANWDHFMDYEKGIAHFDSEKFIRVLEFASRYDEPIPDQGGVLPLLSEEEAMMRGESVLTQQWLNFIRDIHILENETIGKSLAVMGDTASGSSVTEITVEQMYGICENAGNADGAWAFIKYLLSEEYQMKLGGFPILESAYLAEIDYMTNPAYEFSDDNNPHLADRGPGMTQEQVDKMDKMIASMVGNRKYYNSIMEIVYVEAAAFFSGDKSAEATAETINSRVKVFLNERS